MPQTKPRVPGSRQGGNGRAQDVERFEKQLARYLQQRIKPGLNSGAIPLLARSIAHDLAQRSASNGSSESKQRKEPDDGYEAEDFEDEMRDLQEECGDDWIVRFSVQGDDAWLTAEKDDGSQRIEAPTAAVLLKAVRLLNKRGGRSS
jgi:hypothetical protein